MENRLGTEGSPEASKKKNRGFSLVELIIVIAIMAILAAAIAPAVIRYIDKSRRSIDRENAALMYRCVQLALVSSDDEVLDSWYAVGSGVTALTVHEDGYGDTVGSPSYDIVPVLWSYGTYQSSGQNNFVVMDSANLAFSKEFAYNMSQNNPDTGEGETGQIRIKFLKDVGHGVPNAWIIARNVENGETEIWLARKEGSLTPLYRLAPSICSDYLD